MEYKNLEDCEYAPQTGTIESDIGEHEFFIAFNSDEECYAFNNWLDERAWKDFLEYWKEWKAGRRYW